MFQKLQGVRAQGPISTPPEAQKSNKLAVKLCGSIVN